MIEVDNMNKKGFTLIELLAVVIIVSLLTIIVLPKITDSVKNYTKKTDALMLQMIEDAVKLYVEDNSSKFEESLYDYSCIPLTELVDEGYLKEDIGNDKNNIIKTKTLKVTYNNEYESELVNNNECIILDPGLYDENDILLASWGELIEAGLDIETDFSSSSASSKNINILNSYGNKYKLIVDGSVTSIGDYALYNCNKLIEIILTNRVSAIGNNAFYFNTSLTSITIPNSVTSIGNNAFYYNTSLTSITIPSSVTSIGNNVFGYCSKLESIVVDENNFVYDSRENSNAIIEKATNTLIVGCKNTIIPNSVTSIGNNAFYNNTSLTSIIIPNSVTSIGNYAFYGCSSLTSITIPSSVTSIGNYVFGYCSKLESIVVDENNSVYDSRDNSNAIIETATNTLVVGCKNTIIPNSVTSIGKYAFYNNNSLTSIIIPNSVTSIVNNAFFGCSSLTSITIPSSVTSIGNNTFGNCKQLESIVVDQNNSVYDSRDNSNAIIETATNTLVVGCKNTIIPNSVTSIGNSAFYGYSSLTSITIPSSVTSIGNFAFYYNTSLTSITIPSSVTSIANSAFNGCSKLTTIYYSGSATGSPWGATNATVISE